MDPLDPSTWSTPDGPWWRPGRHILGAGTLFVDLDGRGERPLVETSDLTLTVQTDTLERTGSVDGPIQVIDQAVTRVRRTLHTGTVDVSVENLTMMLGGTLTAIGSHSSTVSTRDELAENRWWQLGERPAATTLVAIEDGGGALVAGTDYVFDAARGRVMALSDLTDLEATWSRAAGETVDISNMTPSRGAVRFLALSSSSAIPHDVHFPLCQIRPDGPIALKSRRDWVRLGLEIQVLSDLFSLEAVA